jgi:hypothetical protein
MHEQHQHTPTFKLRLFVVVEQDERSTPKRDNDRSIWKPLPVDKLVRGCPTTDLSIIGGSDVVNERRRLYSVDPHEQRGPGINHPKRGHYCDPADVTLSKVLL